MVLARKQETSTTTTLSLSLLDGSIPRYKSGQYLTVYFPDLSPTLGKQYSISSAPCEQIFRITVKAIGRFSDRLCSLENGDVFIASKPEGTFCPTYRHPLIMLAGGIGITPFRSMIIESVNQRPTLPITLFYSAKLSQDMPFGIELYTFAQQRSSLSIERFATQESSPSSDMKYRRMRSDDILKYTSDNIFVEYLVSGSLSFVLDVKNILSNHGVDRAHILTEACF